MTSVSSSMLMNCNNTYFPNKSDLFNNRVSLSADILRGLCKNNTAAT